MATTNVIWSDVFWAPSGGSSEENCKVVLCSVGIPLNAGVDQVECHRKWDYGGEAMGEGTLLALNQDGDWCRFVGLSVLDGATEKKISVVLKNWSGNHGRLGAVKVTYTIP